MSRVVVSADEFLNSTALDRPKCDVPVPELGEGKVIPIWGMTPRERTEWEDAQSRLSKASRSKHKREIRERILVECCRDDAGNKLFSVEQIERLGQRRGDVVERLVNVALELSGFTGTDLEALAKNLDAADAD